MNNLDVTENDKKQIKVKRQTKLMSYYLGVDVGTGSVRAALVSSDGKICAKASQEINILSTRPDFYEQSSEDIWQSVIKVVKEVCTLSGINKDNIHGIGFDATCSLVVLDKGGNPVTVNSTGDSAYNVVMWMDHRAKEEADLINQTKSEVLKSVGGKISLEMQPPKLTWLKKHLKESCWDKAAHFMDLPDFLTYKASDSLSRSLCSLVCKWMFQADESGEQIWNREFMEAIGLECLLLDNAVKIGNTVCSPGKPCGEGLSDKAAAELNLLPGTPVGTSIIDAHAGVLGCLGCLPEDKDFKLPDTTNRMVLICGTSSCHMIMSQHAIFVPGVWGPYFSAIMPGLWNNEGGQSATGKLIDFVVETHPAYQKAKKMAAERSIHVHLLLNQILEAQVKSSCLSSVCELTKNLHIWPDFHGNRSPVADASLKGMKSGLTLACDLDDLALQYLATMQAIAYGTKHIIEENTKSGHSVKVIYLCGGLRKNTLFVKIHADVTGIPIILPKEEESVLLGAAILGASASKNFISIQQAMQQMCGNGHVVLPTENDAEYHRKKYRVFQKMLDHQREYEMIMNS